MTSSMENYSEAGFGGLCAGMNYDVRDTGYLEDAIAGWNNGNEPHRIWLDDDQMKLDDHRPRPNHVFNMQDFHVEWSHRAMEPPLPQQQSPTSSLQSCMTFISSNEKDGTLKHYIASPFDIVKRGGIEGHTTLEDINFRLLMPPTRPIKHPVGDFAAAAGASASGFGISGKPVVAFTKIHTQGRGTITVIRTR